MEELTQEQSAWSWQIYCSLCYVTMYTAYFALQEAIQMKYEGVVNYFKDPWNIAEASQIFQTIIFMVQILYT